MEKNDLQVLDENRMAVVLLRVLLEKGRINRKTYDRVANIYITKSRRRLYSTNGTGKNT